MGVSYSANNWLSMVLEHDRDFYKQSDGYKFNDGRRVFKEAGPRWEAYQVSDGAGGFENYKVRDV